jgi:proton-dependent oligopeptide transporter, POT family
MTAASEAPSAPSLPGDGKTWFGHPRGLTILFLTEMWTAFSFYGMRTLLVFYMTMQLMMDQKSSSLVYGLYTSLVFFTPVIGGYIADRWMGRKRAVIAGGAIMAAGHFMMAFEPLFYFALITIIIGNGLFQPTLPSQINLLYSESDPRRSRAYNVYYVGVNLGGFLAPLGCGTVGEIYGWHWGFALAGIGMLAGLLIYIAGQRHLPADSVRSAADQPVDARAQTNARPALYFLLVSVAAIVVLFRAAYEQIGNTVQLFAGSGVDRMAGGFEIPATWLQLLNPLMIFLFTPLILIHWARRAKRGREKSTVAKMAIGGFVMALSYLMLAATTHVWSGPGLISWPWMVAFVAIYTVAELYILPVGLGLFGRLAPRGYAATTIAVWFAAMFFGNFAAGAVGTLWSTLSHDQFFLLTAGLAAASGTLLLLLVPWSRRLEATATGS